MTAEVEDFQRCPECGTGLEPRVVGSDGIETVEEAIQAGDSTTARLMVCPNAACPSNRSRP